ncbi:MAG: type II toxin-antitoxin system RelE/ParE family toxin [Patescibacteria group bacterium]
MSLPKSWDLQVDPGIYKFIKQAPRRDAEAILRVIKLLPFNPYFSDIQKINGEKDVWRRRIGSYRILYRIKVVESIILVFKVERRASKSY